MDQPNTHPNGGERRKGDRRVTQETFTGTDRRKRDRRSGTDRRLTERRSGLDRREG